MRTEQIPAAVNSKLIERYDIGIPKWPRSRRNVAGGANHQYIRFERFFVLLVTHGYHDFFLEEANVRDVRTHPIHFAGYTVGYRRGVDRKYHASCRIAPDEYARLKAHLVELACRRSAEKLSEAFWQIPFEPYAPVRRQFLNILRAVNRKRKRAGYKVLPTSALRLRRRIVRPFEDSDELAMAVA